MYDQYDIQVIFPFKRQTRRTNRHNFLPHFCKLIYRIKNITHTHIDMHIFNKHENMQLFIYMCMCT